MRSYLKPIFQNITCLILAYLALAGLQGKASAENSFKPVVELFTSQGCSSCPEADAFLGKLAQRDDLIALTFPVDYWDYLGWKDTLASPQFSERQRAYAKARGDGEVYTPQMVIEGKTHFVGSNKTDIQTHLAKEITSKSSDKIRFNSNIDNETITIHLMAQSQEAVPEKCILWLVSVNSRKTVKIRKGENQGLTITYSNVARDIRKIGEWSGPDLKLQLPIKDFNAGTPDFYVVLLQGENGGPLWGAAKVSVK